MTRSAGASMDVGDGVRRIIQPISYRIEDSEIIFVYATGGEIRVPAVEESRAWARGEITMVMARSAAVKTHAAARESGHPAALAAIAAIAAARSAGHAAGTAHMMGHARNAAAYGIVSALAAATAHEQDSTLSAERDWQLGKMPNETSTPYSTHTAGLIPMTKGVKSGEVG